MNYNDKLWKVKQFVEENFDDPTELVVALGLSVEDFILLLPDVLVANYEKFFTNEDEEDTSDLIGEPWQNEEEDGY